MSIDIDIVTYCKPEVSDFYEFFSGLSAITLLDKTNSDKPCFAVTRCTNSEVITSFTFDGPFNVDCSDLPDKIVSNVLAPRWLIQISLPSCAKSDDFSFAKSFARHIADSCQGAVYDPQKEAIIWTKGSQKRYVETKKEKRISMVQLEWFLPVKMSIENTSKLLLDLLRKHCPEAFPIRYGDYEPLQQKINSANYIPFIETWRDKSRNKGVNFLFWKSKAPCFGGSVFFPDRHDNVEYSIKYNCLKIAMSFDGRALENDIRWCETIVDLFLKISEKLHAFYAASYVKRNVIIKRYVSYDDKTEESPMPRSKLWLGLPIEPVWLSWYGEPYKPFVEKALENFITLKKQKSIFVRMGTEIMNKDQLSLVFPEIPKELLVKYDSSKKVYYLNNLKEEKKENANDISLVCLKSSDYDFADFIPDLE